MEIIVNKICFWKKSRGHRTSKSVKSRQSYSNGQLPYHCSFYYLARALMYDGILLITSCYGNRAKLRPDERLGSYTDLIAYVTLKTFLLHLVVLIPLGGAATSQMIDVAVMTSSRATPFKSSGKSWKQIYCLYAVKLSSTC